VTVTLVLVTPAVRALPILGSLPDALEGYIRPIPGLTNFTVFPWAAFVSAGVLVGMLLDSARTPDADRRANVWLGAIGVALAFVAWRASFLPPLDPRSAFWTTSASFFAIRLGVMIAGVTAAYLWEQRPALRPFDRFRAAPRNAEGRSVQAGKRWSPLLTLGRSSLFVYWIHVELVYGLISLPLHHAFSLQGAWLALAVFSALMVACAEAKDKLSNWWKGGSVTPHKSLAYAGSSAGVVKP